MAEGLGAIAFAGSFHTEGMEQSALSIRFQADNDLKRIIVDATLRREPRIDFQTAQAARLDVLDDEAVLRFAASECRILVSHDRRTIRAALTSFGGPA